MKATIHLCLLCTLTLASLARSQVAQLATPPESIPEGGIISLLEGEKPTYVYFFASGRTSTLLLAKLLELKTRGLSVQLICDNTSCAGANMQAMKTQVPVYRLPGTIGSNLLLTDKFASSGGLGNGENSALFRDKSMLIFMQKSLLAPLKNAPRI